MGLFSFLKKKQDIVSPPPMPANTSDLFKNDADLNLPPLPPSFDGLATPPKTSDLSFTLPPLENPTTQTNTLFTSASSTSSSDSLSDQKTASAMHEGELPPLYQSLAPLGDFKLPEINGPASPSTSSSTVPGKKEVTPIDPETLNDLFLKDTDWKEPDWKTFEPYHEETIEQPQQHDFGFIQKNDLPEFDVVTEKSVTPTHVRSAVDIYVQGTDCIKIRQEVESIDQTLAAQEIHTKKLEDINMHEQLFTDAKNSMEFIQKRLMYMDRKLFS